MGSILFTGGTRSTDSEVARRLLHLGFQVVDSYNPSSGDRSEILFESGWGISQSFMEALSDHWKSFQEFHEDRR